MDKNIKAIEEAMALFGIEIRKLASRINKAFSNMSEILNKRGNKSIYLGNSRVYKSRLYDKSIKLKPQVIGHKIILVRCRNNC